MNFQKTALFVFSKCIVLGARHDWWAWLSPFCTAITKRDILYMFYQFQDPIKVIRRYEGCHYTRLESYYIIFYFETDWSRIRPLPSTTLILINTIATPILIKMHKAWLTLFKTFNDEKIITYVLSDQIQFC